MTVLAPPGVDLDRPVRVGDASAAFSTCTDLAPVPLVCWDVNGYYRALGVPWRATWGHLRVAYLRAGGHRSVWLTYVLAQLVDRDVRRRYDRCPLGSVYPDRYVRLVLRREEAMRLSRAAAECCGDPAAFARWVQDHDLEAVEPDATDSLGMLDSGSARAQDDEAPPAPVFDYGYYRWSCYVDPMVHPDRLARWQGYLVRAASRRGVRTVLAVGLCGSAPQWCRLVRVGRLDVAFLRHDVEPDQDLAEHVIDLLD